MAEKPTQNAALLALLKDKKWHSERELWKIAHRFGARLHELKTKHGYSYESKANNDIKGKPKVKGHLYWYRKG